MADFCSQCSITIFGQDLEDLAGITTPEQWAEGDAAVVLCEGCGITWVNPDGKCVSRTCDLSHGMKGPPDGY